MKMQLVKQVANTWAKCATHILKTSFAFELPLKQISVKKKIKSKACNTKNKNHIIAF